MTIILTSTISTSIATPKPTKVAIKTPPSERRVIPSESSRTGHSFLKVLFQYLAVNSNKISFRAHVTLLQSILD